MNKLRQAGLMVVAVVAAGLLWTGSARADEAYGEGAYSGCRVGAVCAPVSPSPTATPAATPEPEPTIGETPTGLEFAVNLSDGQQLPRPSYTVVVTPLNGQGRTFVRVEFYVDGQLVFTASPDDMGTARWEWQTASLSSATVKVVVYDTDGSATPKEFRVTIVPETPVVTPTTTEEPKQTILDVILPPAAVEEIRRLVKQIPLPAAKSFPYVLFVLLGLVLLVLVVQARREIRRIELVRAGLARERMIAEEKITFLQLISHYLRTPLTLIQAGVDSLTMAKVPLAPETMNRIGIVVTGLRLTVEGLLKRMDENARLAEIPPEDEVRPSARIWAAPGFWLPVGLIAMVTFVFNYLVTNVGDIGLSAVDLVSQVVVLALLGLGLYQLLRGRSLRKQQQAQTEAAEEHQRLVDEARNEFIRECVRTLSPDVNRVGGILPFLDGASQFAGVVRNGYERYRKLIASLSVTEKLQAGQTHALFQPVTLGGLVEQARVAVAAAASAKQVQIQVVADAPLASQQPKWLSYVLVSVLDNAVAYSAAGGAVEVAAVPGAAASITVTDHGMGLTPDKQAQVFQPFYKAEGALTFTHEGAGLSLYVARLIMHYLGGEIGMESRLGQGTRVTLTFPTG